MDNIDNMLLNVSKHTRHLFEKLCSTEDYRPEWKEIQEFLTQQLYLNPYPTLQILNYHTTQESGICAKIIYNTLLQYLGNHQVQKSREFYDKFLNFVANFQLQDEWLWQAYETMFPKLLPMQGDVRCELYLSLLARPTRKLLNTYLEYGLQQAAPLSKPFILYKTLYNREHAIANVLAADSEQSVPLMIPNGKILKIAKLVSQMSNPKKTSSRNCRFFVDLSMDWESCSEICSILDVLYLDLNRIVNIFDMLEKYSKYEMPLEKVISSQSFLDLLFQQTRPPKMRFSIAMKYVTTNHTLYNKMLRTDTPNIESDIFAAYSVLSLICDMFFLNKKCPNYSQDVDDRLVTIVGIMQGITDTKIFIKLLQNIFLLFFLRWENMPSISTTETKMLSSSTDQPNDYTVLNAMKDADLSGFICSKYILEKLLKVLQDAITKQLQYSKLNEIDRNSLESLEQSVKDSFWRLSYFEKKRSSSITTTITRPLQIDLIEVSKLIGFHTEMLQHASSDEDQVEDGSSILLRRKQKIRRKQSNNAMKIVLESNVMNPIMGMNVYSGSMKEDRSTIARMLSSPLDLATICMSRENVEGALEIIQKFNLKDTKLERDISLLANMREVKIQLEKVIERYEEQETYLKTASTIEHIKKIAAIGFETSKITNIIEKFSQTNQIVPDAENAILIDKYCKSFQFLQQYKLDMLQISIILDLILNLNINYEIGSNILNMTNRLYGSAGLLEQLSSQEDLYRGIGSVYFFNNLVECLCLFKKFGHENIGMKTILIDTCYPLRPNSLKSELERENIFKGLYNQTEVNFASIKCLQSFAKSYEEFKPKTNYYTRFSKYITNLSKLLQFRRLDCPDNVTEIMKIDIGSVIGEILFEMNVIPVDIEAIVFSLNLNLVHMIALNICPQIGLAARTTYNIEMVKNQDVKGYEYKIASICAYVSRHNSLLDYVLKQISGQNKSEVFMNSEYFKKLLELHEVIVLSQVYDYHQSIAALLFDHFNIVHFKHLSAEIIIEIYKVAREKYHKSSALISLKDDAITKTVVEDISTIQLIEYIRDINLRARIFLDDLINIHDSEIATKLIKSILLDDQIDELDIEKKEQLERALKDIEVYSEIAEDFLFQSWTVAFVFSEKSSDLIMKKLIKLKKYELCHEWWQLQNHSRNLSLKYFHEVFFESLIHSKKRIHLYLLKIIESFPVDEVVCFYETNIEKFKNRLVLNYVVHYLIENNTIIGESDPAAASVKYHNFKISLNIFNHMTNDECEQNWELISRPLLIIEQFVINSKFDILTEILNRIRPLVDIQACKYCNGQTNMIYEIPMNSSITLGNPKNSAFLLLNFNLYQKDHIITAGCIDTILQIYATKALDYRINESQTSNDPVSLSTELSSLDSLCGTFIIPKEAPTKDNWIKDEDSVQCMCCKRAIFTMLTRRHHCRRCGRVICYSCSTNRLKIPNLYDDIPVRVCNDCYMHTQALENRLHQKSTITSSEMSVENKKKRRKNTDWQLSGNLTHDKLLREEFSYEHAPSAHLCLSILSFHSNNPEYVNLLLHHCRKFEKLLRPLRAGYPNPEIDYGLVAKMLNCLALAAKVRGGPPECDIIRDHSEIIISVVQNGCEALLPMEPINNTSLRKLGDSMVLAEKWPLALDIYLKCGHSTAGVMAAYGLACLRVGRFETAREQLLYCMTRLCKQKDSINIKKIITSDHDIDQYNEIDIPIIKRPNRSPPLLDEIVKVIEATSRQSPVPETLARADSIRNSNSSLASSKLKAKELLLEPALNIINTISNLKYVSQGNYCDNSISKLDNRNSVIKHSPMFDECLYYLLAYGTHSNILNFLIRHNQTLCALKYFIVQNIDSEFFIHNIYIKHLKRGNVDHLIRQMMAIDDHLSIWKEPIIQTCRYLETKNLMNSLYHLQILLNDPIRASMTCVKFYSSNCLNFRDLQNNSFHLVNAQKHLQSELEMCQWENINSQSRHHTNEPSFLMQMDAKTLNGHINTILRQMEVTKFLAKCEQDEKSRRSTRQILKQIGIETTAVPTLFDSIQEKIQICILVLLCGNNIEEGFGLAYRIIQDYNLPSMKIYGTSGKYLARNNRLAEVEKLINCVKSNNGTDHSEHDKILSLSIHAATNAHTPETKSVLDNLIKFIIDVETKIECHIYVGQLKSAYLLAVQHNRMNDVKKILRHAESLNQIHILRLCKKKLNMDQ